MIILTDNRVCLRHEKDQLRKQVEEIKTLGVKIVPVAFGTHVNLRELEKIKSTGSDVIHSGEYEDHRKVGKKILFGKLIIKSGNLYNFCTIKIYSCIVEEISIC